MSGCETRQMSPIRQLDSRDVRRKTERRKGVVVRVDGGAKLTFLWRGAASDFARRTRGR